MNILLTLYIATNLISCSNKDEKVSLIKEDSFEVQMIEAYNEGLKELNKGDILILDNRYMAHGRTKFQFDKKGLNSRVLLRTWIK